MITRDAGETELRRGPAILIVAGAGRVRDGLHSLLAANGRVGAVYVADGGEAMLRSLAEYAPALVVFGPDAGALLAQVRALRPGARCVAFVEGAEQEGHARAAGADAVVWMGFPAVRLAALIEGLLAAGEEGYLA